MDKLCALLKHHKDVSPLTGIQCFLINLEGEADSFCVICPFPHRMRGTGVLRRQPPLMLSPLCTSSLVVNLWSYVTKVSLAAGLSSSPVPFLRIRPTSSSPLAGEVVMCMVCMSEGEELGWPPLCFVRAIRADPPSRTDEIFSPLQSGRLSGDQPFIPGKSNEHRCSPSTVPSLSFMQTKHSHLLLLTERLHWSTEDVKIKKVFPSLCAGITGSGPDIDNRAVLSQCLEASRQKINFFYVFPF